MVLNLAIIPKLGGMVLHLHMTIDDGELIFGVLQFFLVTKIITTLRKLDWKLEFHFVRGLRKNLDRTK